MREQLYREIAHNYHNIVIRVAIVTSIAGIREGAPFHFWEKFDINFGIWNFYNDEIRRELLFSLKEAGQFAAFTISSLPSATRAVQPTPICVEKKRRLKLTIGSSTAAWTGNFT